MLRQVQRELERNGHQYSIDKQALIRMQAQSIKATVEANRINKKYSYNEDD